MKLLCFYDPHISYTNPANRIDNYYSTCLNKISEIKDISDKEKCHMVLCTGDLFHIKSWTRNPYSMVSELIDLFKSFKIPVKTTYGNHDLAAGDDDSIDKQPLGVLCRGANIEILRKNIDYRLDEETILTATPFFRDIDKNVNSYMPEKKKCKSQIHITHGSLIPKKPIWEEYTLYSSINGCNADWLINGHLHKNYGIQNVGDTRIANVGSLTRATLSEDDLNRKPSVLIIDTVKNNYKIIELKSAPDINKCFDIKKIEKQEKAEEEIDKLAELIKKESGEIEINSLDGIKQMVRELKSIDGKVKDTCYELLDKAEEIV